MKINSEFCRDHSNTEMSSLAIDLGATSGRVVLGKYTGESIEMTEEISDSIIPQKPVNDRLLSDSCSVIHFFSALV